MLSPLTQLERGAERNQHRRQVADRRAVGDIAADRAAGAHLDRAEAAQHFGEIGIDRAEDRHGARQRYDRPERKAVGRLFDLRQLGDAADMDDLFDRRELLGDPQPDVGRAGDDGGVGMLRDKGAASESSLAGAAKNAFSSPTKRSASSSSAASARRRTAALRLN